MTVHELQRSAPYQLILTSGISETARIEIARKKEVEMTLAIQKKKDREEGGQVECVTHKKQKSKQSENLKKRDIGAVEEEEQTSTSKRKKLNRKRRLIMELEDAEANS